MGCAFPAAILFQYLHSLGPTALVAPLARIMHAWSAAGLLSSVLTAFPTLGLLGRVHDYACAALGRKALSARRFRPFASTTRELCGLGPVGSPGGASSYKASVARERRSKHRRHHIFQIKSQPSPAPGRWPDDSRKKLELIAPSLTLQAP